MAGSHRAPQSRSTAASGRARLLALLLVAAVAAAIVLFLVRDGDDDRRGTGSTESPTSTPSSTPSPTPSVTPTPTPTPTAAVPTTRALPALTPAPPRRLLVDGLVDVGFDDSIEPSGGRFQTRSTAELSRWGSRGLPGSPGRDTVVIAGRIAADGDSAFGALPRVAVGRRIEIRTEVGVLTYSVRSVQSRPAEGLTAAPVLADRVPGRLVLIGIKYRADGSASGNYFVVTAELTGVRRS